MSDKLVYTAKEVAEMIGCSISTAYEKIRKWNKEYASKNKILAKNLTAGRVSKEIFHKYYPCLEKIN